MAKKRNYIDEIIEKKSRLLKRTKLHYQFTQRLHPVVNAFQFVSKLKTKAPLKKELLKYGPIGYVACIEGYFRLLLKELIDYGSPYSENVSKLEEVKFTAEVVIAITS